ncbi:MAG: hypothetical protein ACXWRZ_13545 [Bdellovibrio sp.]
MKKYLSIPAVLLATILFFQNCAKLGGSSDSSSAVDPMSSLALEKNAMQVLNAKCVQCHNTQTPSGGISYLTDINSLLYYRLVVPRDPGSSLLFQVIQEGQMPPGNPLSEQEISAINNWIIGGLNSSTPASAPK